MTGRVSDSADSDMVEFSARNDDQFLSYKCESQVLLLIVDCWPGALALESKLLPRGATLR